MPSFLYNDNAWLFANILMLGILNLANILLNLLIDYCFSKVVWICGNFNVLSAFIACIFLLNVVPTKLF